MKQLAIDTSDAVKVMKLKYQRSWYEAVSNRHKRCRQGDDPPLS